MKRIESICAVGVLAVMVLVGGCEKFSPKANPVVVIETSMGAITAELWEDSAPQTVKNFLAYVDAKHFDGLIFHRVKRGFMIQGGGFDPTLNEKAIRQPVKNEATADKKNDRGTLAMARTPVVDSATSQFFINLVDNAFLNHSDNSPRGFGYCAFGKVTDGMDVVDKIGAVATENVGGHEDVPTKPIIIISIRRKK
jgi:peptidyl-prolyl cis-trans isomerase A (cyclophilin A)